MKNIGLLVTIVYVAVSYGSGFITGHVESWHAVGVGDAVLDLTSSFLEEIGKAIATVALTLGLALPSIRGDPVVSVKAAPPPEEKKPQ